jgi:DNA-binding NarL/FixJ family response regulator
MMSLELGSTNPPADRCQSEREIEMEADSMIQQVLSPTPSAPYPMPNSDETAFRTWISRRDTARQQIRRLSRRELQVVQLVSNGLANKTIASELQISVKTIEKHRANAARKLGVNSTAEMVRIAVQADQEAQERSEASGFAQFATSVGISVGN